MIPAKTSADLGWGALLEHLAARCHTIRGAERARALAPSTDAGWIRARIGEVTEARGLYDTGEPMTFGGVTDVEPALARAEKGGHLEGSALREIGATVAAGAHLRRHLSARAARAPRIVGRAALIAELADLSGAVEDSFDDAC
jgi:DNA mismatch repair protein MutS2